MSNIKAKIPLTDVDRKRIKEMSETGQNCAPLLNQRIIRGERFDNCIIEGILISGENLRATKFFRCKINMTANKTDFSNSIFKDCTLRGEANYANFSACDFGGSDLAMLKLRHSDMTKTNICGTKISLFTPNLFRAKFSKNIIEAAFKMMFDSQDDGYEPPAHMLRG